MHTKVTSDKGIFTLMSSKRVVAALALGLTVTATHANEEVESESAVSEALTVVSEASSIVPNADDSALIATEEGGSPPEQIEMSSTGAQLGQVVMFPGVGKVFYAGKSTSNHEVFFSIEDEVGPYKWEDALSICQKKGPGWRLPAAEHLKVLYTNAEFLDLGSKGISQSSGNWYWSSSALDDESAYRQRFSDGLTQGLKKRYSARVRCARAYN